MGKTFRKDSQYRPKKRGKTFVKEQAWKKNNRSKPFDSPLDSTKDGYPE